MTPSVQEQKCAGRTHDWIDQRSLAFDQVIAEKIRAKPELMEYAKKVLERWIDQREPPAPKALLEWRTILTTWPTPKILDLLTRFDEEARRLRQSSPFCGILSPEERLSIIAEHNQL